MKSAPPLTQFEKIAEVFPDNIAVETGSHSITYRELNRSAEQIAETLKEKTIGQNRIAAVYLDSSAECVAAILGIMKADAIYMPLNTKFPPHRLSSVLKKTNPDVFITNRLREAELVGKLKQTDLNTAGNQLLVFNGQILSEPQNYTFSAPPKSLPSCIHTPPHGKPDDSCYIITTSGSTGEPKVILGSREGLTHFINWEKNEFGLKENTRCSQLSPVSFDVSLRDIFVPLTSGGTLCIPGEEIKQNPEKLVRWMEECKLTLIHIVPTLFRMVTRVLAKKNGRKRLLPNLQYALIAGEMLFGNDITNWAKAAGDHVELVNIYGPSETTLAKMFYRIKQNNFASMDTIPVGKPLPDTEIRIVNGQSLCDFNETGEIYIKTSFMSNGYYNAPELNKKAFVPDPVSGDQTSILYKTGDTGFLTEDRTVKLTGRIDGQIKLHGKRIETGEVEVALMRHPSIESAAVIDWTDNHGHKRLVGYIVTEHLITITVETLREFLRKLLPDHMVPNTFVHLKSMPLNHSGKIDRKALPVPSQNRPEMAQDYEPPASPTEKKVAAIWSQYLGIDKIGVLDNFFDLGGTSILSTEVITKLNRNFQVSLDVVKLFQFPTIRMLSNHLNGGKDPSLSVSQLQDRGKLRQRSVQRRNRPGVRV